MDDDDDDDLFDDADLQEIEQHALAATQGAPSAAHDPPAIDDFDDSYGFDDEDVINLDAEDHEAPMRSVLQPQYAQPHSRSIPHPQATSRTAVATGWRRHGLPTRPPQQQQHKQPPPPLPAQASAPRREPTMTQPHEVPYGYAPAEDPTATLQARIAELEAEHKRLLQAANDAQSAMYAKAGEISIVRSNHDKATREYERRISLMQKIHAEEVAKQRAELDAAKKDVEKSETDRTFLEHDLRIAQDARKRVARESQAQRSHDLFATPKKATKTMSFRDGFDDDEVIMVSPTKSRERRKKDAPTPPGRAKRKRSDAQQSPSKPLSFVDALSGGDAGQMDVDDGYLPSMPDALPLPLRPKERKNDYQEKFDFMRFVLDHKAWPHHDRTLERLTKYEFPLNPSVSIASRIHDFLAALGDDADAPTFRTRCCERVMEVWTQCFEHKSYASLKDLVVLLQDTLVQGPSQLASSLVPKMVTLCFTAADYMALKAIRAHMDPKRHPAPSLELCAQLDPLDYLDLADIVALHCSSLQQDNAVALQLFWSKVPPETVLMLLNKIQPLDQIHSLLSLLTSSVLHDSFGARSSADTLADQASKHQQIKNEDSLLKRLTVLLFETPLPRDADNAYTSHQVLSLRLAILNFLSHVCITAHGGRALAAHPLVIGRLARFIHECVVTMYAYQEATHDMTVGLLNRAVKLLHYLSVKHKDAFDLRQRLAVVPGGTHMHLVALSRVAFAEGQSVIERGIEPQVAEFAHDMLDDHLSPDEGDAVMQVFSTAVSRKD